MLVGHREQGRALRDAFDGGRMHHAWLLAGPRGIGKASFARAAAAWVLARAAGHSTDDDRFDLDPDHPTARLIAAGSHLDLRVIEMIENPKTGKMRPGIALDQFVRRDTTIGEPLASIFRSTPALSEWRVVIVDAVDDMNRAAANAFLKNLEEPPPRTLFFGVCHSPGRLLPTIRSRCRVLRFQMLADDDVAAVVARHLPEADEETRSALAAVSGGSPGHAVQLADADVAGLRAALDGIATATVSEASARAFGLAKSVATKSAQPRYEALLDIAPAYLAEAARDRSGARLARALSLWEKASALASSALPLSLDPQGVAFELAELVGGLASSASNRSEPHDVA